MWAVHIVSWSNHAIVQLPSCYPFLLKDYSQCLPGISRTLLRLSNNQNLWGSGSSWSGAVGAVPARGSCTEWGAQGSRSEQRGVAFADKSVSWLFIQNLFKVILHNSWLFLEIYVFLKYFWFRKCLLYQDFSPHLSKGISSNRKTSRENTLISIIWFLSCLPIVLNYLSQFFIWNITIERNYIEGPDILKSFLKHIIKAILQI